MTRWSIGISGSCTIISPPRIIKPIVPSGGAWGSSTFVEKVSGTALRDAVWSSKDPRDGREGKEDGGEGDHIVLDEFVLQFQLTA